MDHVAREMVRYLDSENGGRAGWAGNEGAGDDIVLYGAEQPWLRMNTDEEADARGWDREAFFQAVLAVVWDEPEFVDDRPKLSGPIGAAEALALVTGTVRL